MFSIAAHRGGNDLNSIRQSIEKGFHFLELDAHMSMDGYIIVQYSPLISIGNEKHYIQNINYSELEKGTRDSVLLLNDVLDLCNGKIGVVIDIKKGKNFYDGIGAAVGRIVSNSQMIDNCWIISFDHLSILDAKNYNQRLNVAPMYVARLNDDIHYWKSLQSDGVEVCIDYFDEATASRAKKNGIVLVGWCTRDRQELIRLVENEVDIITIEKDDDDSFQFLKKYI